MSTTVFTDVNARVSASGTSESMNEKVFGKKIGILTRMFGCQHKNLSRPFSYGRQGYRACINCGSRQQFNPSTLETHGAFYAAPPAERAEHF